ncbi:hypothetical protein FNV43_RR07627 [Rhamnella rubrinervis]|uniref:DUF1985 domain-containing protein n=1 Tax=Rhamnella rubrinervis TaxID=2594499 RepID=A0A8K0HF35_9ROSA|nr:hypothetical protein FNV43_RR07627 [Rhamnella rubrinervis]
MTPKKKAVVKPNKRQVKAKPSKKTTSDPKIAAKPPLTAEDIAPSVNPSIKKCPDALKMCPIHQIPNDSVVVKFCCGSLFCHGEQIIKLRKYIVETNSQDDSIKLTNYGNFSNAIDVIRRNLRDDGVQAFKSTCFGHFLDVKSMTFCSAIVHSFLVRVLECDDLDVLEFNFRGIGARFDRNAFNLVTGLKFSQFLSLVETHDLLDTLWDKYFGVRGTLEQKEFMTKFERYPFDETDVEDNVKVYMFYLLETVLLTGDKRKLIWCFETIPIPTLLGCENYFLNRCPRIHRWEFPRKVHFETIEKNIFKKGTYPVHNRLHLTAQEKKEAYITSFFRSIAYRSYDGPLSVVEDVDDTTVDPTSEQVQSDRRHLRAALPTCTSSALGPYATSKMWRGWRISWMILIRRCNSLCSTLALRYENHSSGGVHHSMDPPGGSPIVHTDPVEPVGGSPTIYTDPGERFIVVYAGSLHTPPPHHALVASTSSRKFRRLVKAHAPVMQKKYTHPSERLPSPSCDWTLDMNDDAMTNYVKGISPLLSRSWRDVDRVYVPVNNENKQWLAAEVDLVWRHVTLYDSSCTASNDSFQTCNAESLGVLFPYLLAAGGFYDERP